MRSQADETTFLGALDAVNEELRDAFDPAWRGLTDSERRALAAVATSAGRPTRREALDRLDLPRTTAQEALARLRDDGQIALDADGRWSFVDPLFGRWIAEGRPPE